MSKKAREAAICLFLLAVMEMQLKQLYDQSRQKKKSAMSQDKERSQFLANNVVLWPEELALKQLIAVGMRINVADLGHGGLRIDLSDPRYMG